MLNFGVNKTTLNDWQFVESVELLCAGIQACLQRRLLCYRGTDVLKCCKKFFFFLSYMTLFCSSADCSHILYPAMEGTKKDTIPS